MRHVITGVGLDNFPVGFNRKTQFDVIFKLVGNFPLQPLAESIAFLVPVVIIVF